MQLSFPRKHMRQKLTGWHTDFGSDRSWRNVILRYITWEFMEILPVNLIGPRDLDYFARGVNAIRSWDWRQVAIVQKDESQRKDDRMVDSPTFFSKQYRYRKYFKYLFNERSRRLHKLTSFDRRVYLTCQSLLMDSPEFLRATREDECDDEKIGTSSIHRDSYNVRSTSRLKVRIRAWTSSVL